MSQNRLNNYAWIKFSFSSLIVTSFTFNTDPDRNEKFSQKTVVHGSFYFTLFTEKVD